MKQFSAMQLSKGEIRTLYRVFRKVDMDGSGNIALPELLAHIDLERTKFTERIFSIFDEDGSGEIDFREFVLSLWNYCTLTKATLGTFRAAALLSQTCN
jgi:serine/threonine-protein phosphatase 2B regulatory subunit